MVVGIPTVLVERHTQLKTGKQDLLRYLAELLQRLRNHLLVNVDLTAGQFSRVEECFNALERSLGEQIGKVTSQKLAEAQTESNRLAEEAQLDDKQRKAKAEETRHCVAEWDSVSDPFHQGRAGRVNRVRPLCRMNSSGQASERKPDVNSRIHVGYMLRLLAK